MDTNRATRSAWGRARFGGSSTTLLVVSLTIGALISAGLGGLFLVLGTTQDPILAFSVVFVVTLPVSAALGWAVLVDRSTLAGALDKPEDSIESAWYDKAASGAFGDILIVGGLSAGGLGLAGVEAPLTWAISALVLFAMLDLAVRYVWLKRSAQ
ncbi:MULTISPECIES: hypothetical protein [Micrococcaceae]|jgi:hypothetical protein|uniref:hypothetical protein n=1 Tax=Micrococcaceae TaxID=1268 RepID=UPI00160C1994|nr:MULTISPECIES: hypothetical protein [Micrococcaceae]MBB5748717.1 hypothetical protein [Micrococcus sp. TA1]HRO31447.1 hypothetical protein [Citricoccus sp.]HRO94801.1 hypothetical protein [Citricoccus sp.]